VYATEAARQVVTGRDEDFSSVVRAMEEMPAVQSGLLTGNAGKL
jgi:hypothetical protein